MVFEWNEAKAKANLRNHGVTFQEAKPTKKNVNFMKMNNDDKKPSINSLKRGRRVTRKEHDRFRHALEQTYHRPFPSRMGRPPKGADKYLPISIKMHPVALAWAKWKANATHVKYQALINSILLEKAKHDGKFGV